MVSNSSAHRSRLMGIITRLLTERSSRKDEPDAVHQPGLVAGAIGQLVDFLDNRRESFSFLRFQGTMSRDAVVSPGETVSLTVNLDPLIELAARKVAFTIGEEVIGEVERDDTGQCTFVYRPLKPGLFVISYRVYGSSGKQINLESSPPTMTVQVIDGSPVAVVDANLILERDSQTLSNLKRLEMLGWKLCYADLNRLDRTQQIAEALESHDLPRGAILVHPLTDVEFKTLEVDFRKVFAAATMRRIRSAGVPLVLLLCDAPGTWELVEQDGVMIVDLGSLADLLADNFALTQLQTIVTQFMRQRRESRHPITWRLDCMTGTSLIEGNSCSAEFDNHLARQRIFSAIDEAEHSIHLQFYIFKESQFTDYLAVHLIRKARMGVTVRLMVDALYSTQDLFGLKNRIVEGLAKEKNIEVVASDPIKVSDELQAVLLKQRDHRKMLIIDGKRAFIGGRNAGDEYYTGFDEVAITDWTPAEKIPWLDAHVEVAGPLVNEIQRCFMNTWHANKGERIPEDDHVLPVHLQTGSCRARFIFHNGIADSNGLAAYEAMIDAARDHIYILNDFPVVSSLGTALREAVAKGIRVRFLTGNALARRMDHTFFKGPLYRELFEYMTKGRFYSLLKSGIVLYEYTTRELDTIVTIGGKIRPYVHAKVVSVDGLAASIGSANLDATASYWEREANVIVEDETFVTALETQIEAMFDESMKIDEQSDYWREEEKHRDLVNLLWPDMIFS